MSDTPAAPADVIAKVLRVHSGEEFEADDFPTLEEGQAAWAALASLLAERDLQKQEAQHHYECRREAESERDEARAELVEARTCWAHDYAKITELERLCATQKEALEPLMAEVEKVSHWLRSIVHGREPSLTGSPAAKEAIEREVDTCRMAAEDLEKAVARAALRLGEPEPPKDSQEAPGQRRQFNWRTL